MDNNILMTNLNEMIYFYRGAITYDRALLMSPSEREISMKVVNKRLEIASKMTNPVF
jgi:hypothetical protein